MRDLSDPESGWTPESQRAPISEGFAADRVEIIMVDGEAVGWTEVEETDAAFHLHQIHLVRESQGLGIGSAIIRQLLGVADQVAKPVRLEVRRSNGRAFRLYEQLGFGIEDTDDQKIYMARQCNSA